MITLDSLTIAIAREFVEVNAMHFYTTRSPDGNVLKMTAKPILIGIIVIEVMLNIVRITVSAKILLEQYKLGININTIDRVLDKINESGIIKLNSYNLADYQVHKCDFVANFCVDKPRHDYYCALSIVHNPYYQNRVYSDKYSNGFAFIGQQVKNNKYLKFYDKDIELNRSCNRQFIRAVDNDKLQNDFSDVIRIEFRAISLTQIRTYCDIESNSLESLLLSHANPIHKVFCEILRGNTIKSGDILQLEDINQIKDFESLIKQIGYQYWLSLYDNDINKALSPIKQILQVNISHASNRSRKLRSYKEFLQNAFINKMLASNDSCTSKNIDEISNFLLSQ